MMLPIIHNSYNLNNHVIKLKDGCFNDVIIFQSYDATMCVITNNDIYFNNDASNYTKTTCKYLYKFLYDYKYDGSIKTASTIENILNAKNKKDVILNHVILTNKSVNDVEFEFILEYVCLS